MPRTCSVCTNPERAAIDAALLAGEPFRKISERFEVSATAAFRHRQDHLPATLRQATQAAEAARADDLLAQLRQLQEKALELLRKAEAAGDYRTALAGVREARGCLELLAELTHELDRRPTVNLLVAPEWLAVRAALMAALWPYPEARAAVAATLAQLEVEGRHVGD